MKYPISIKGVLLLDGQVVLVQNDRNEWELPGGRLEIGETSVFIAVSSPHRPAAFEACRFAIDTLKRTVPIWKKEYFEDGAIWADGEMPPAPAETRAAKPASQ